MDDTDLTARNLTLVDLTIHDIHSSIQAAIERWEGGLKATEGAIRPDKSFVYPLDLTYNKYGKAVYRTPEDIGKKVTVKDENHDEQDLQQYPAHHGEETLGVILSPDGNVK